MFIKNIENFSGYEADIIVSDGVYELKCYSYFYPPKEKISECTVIKEINTFSAQDIIRAEKQEFGVIKNNAYYSYMLRGKVVEINPPFISIGNIMLKLDSQIAKDLQKGDFVEFIVQRLDCTLDN